MKRYFLLLLITIPTLLSAQTFDTMWNNVDRLIRIKNFKETAPYIQQIKTKAKQENNSPQWIRAILAENHALTINMDIDSGFYTIQNHFESHIGQANKLEKAILQNFYAQFLASNHEYAVRQNSGFLSLSLNKRNNFIDSLFRNSLTDIELLNKEKIEKWEIQLKNAKNSSLTPTIYHLLAYSYLEFLQAYKKETDELLTNIQNINDKHDHADARSYLIFKPLLPNNIWSIEGNIHDIKKLIGQRPANYEAYVHFMIANYYKNRNRTNDAIQELTIAMDKYPSSPWQNELRSMYEDLTKVEIDIKFNTFSPQKEYIPIKIIHSNTDQLYIRVYNTTCTPKNFDNFLVKFDSITNQTSINAPLIYEESIELKPVENHEKKSTIYKINPLPYGNYRILLSNNKDFKDDNYLLDVTQGRLVISDLFISPTVEKEHEFNDFTAYTYNVQLINRKSGLPFRNKSVKLYEENKNDIKHISSSVTNHLGEFTYRSSEMWNIEELDYLSLYIPDEKQFIDLSDIDNFPRHYRERYDDKDDKFEIKTMTDRAIYRPGQRVFFKSIYYNDDYFQGKILPNKLLTVYLLDANRVKVDSTHLITNLFGSIDGSFLLPSNTLNGNLQISVYHNSKYISSHFVRIEEYKRPAFKVTFDTNKETYSRKDTAKFSGLAESFSGAKLPNITVNYKITTRNLGHYDAITVQDSSIVTDNEGKFHITVPLSHIRFDQFNDFNINITADAINENGEIQSTNYQYNYSDKPWVIQFDIPKLQVEYKWKELTVKTTNNNNQPLPIQGKINIYKIDPLSIIIGEKKPFDFRADYHLLKVKEYQTYFPNYFDPSFLDHERPKTLIATYDFDTNDTSIIYLDSSLFDYGEYFIEAISIQKGEVVTNNTTTKLISSQTFRSSDKEFLRIKTDKPSYKVNDQVTIHIQSDVLDASGVYLWKIENGKKKKPRFIKFKDSKASYSFTIKKSDMFSSILFETGLIKDNKIETKSLTIPITISDKSLHVITTTFRDKITPGQSEKWSFAIKKKNSPVFAEVLATMYDSSLDEFSSNSFDEKLASFPYYNWYSQVYPGWMKNNFYSESSLSRVNYSEKKYSQIIPVKPPLFNSYGLSKPYFASQYESRTKSYSVGSSVTSFNASDNALIEEVVVTGLQGAVPGLAVRGSSSKSIVLYDQLKDPSLRREIEMLKKNEEVALYGSQAAHESIVVTTKDDAKKAEMLNQVQTRTNLQETAFFYPNLLTDKEGNVFFEFDSPEALTRWKLLLFAHTKDLDAGTATLFTQTQKQLMVRPNIPRFLREGDEVVIKTQIQNLSDKTQQGSARIEIINPENNENISAQFSIVDVTKDFSVDASNNSTIAWKLKVPEEYPAIHVKIVAATEEFSDGEQHETAILPNRILISDTEKIVLRANESKTYHITSKNKDNLQARIQVQSNPILEIISALDYLKNYPYECNEQTASKWYGLKMLQYLQQQYPAIATYFKNINPEEVITKMESNTALSELLITEMPWLKDIKGDEAKLKSLATLFNTNLDADINTLEQKLQKAQMHDGLFSWFDGGKKNTFISIRILEVMGKVAKLDKKLISSKNNTVASHLIKSLDIDTSIYNKNANESLKLDYLYARQFWNDLIPLAAERIDSLKKVMDKSSETTATRSAGYAAKSLIINRTYGLNKQAEEIRNRIAQEVVYDGQKGMYWTSNGQHYNSITLQSYLVEAYKDIDSSKLDQITQWIYYNKQHNNWSTTWNTVDAVYSLLLVNNPNDFNLDNTITISVDGNTLDTNNKVLGQVSAIFEKEDLIANKSVGITNNNIRTIYGNVVHQYFIPLDDATASKKEMSVNKKILIQKGEEWIETTTFTSGDKIKVQLTIINNEPLSYVHLKDSRAAGFEPIYQPSGYQYWKGYYFTIKDASTNYFFDYLPKGKHIYEYEVKTNNTGVFNCGIAQIECMYDPAKNARSENLKVIIKE